MEERNSTGEGKHQAQRGVGREGLYSANGGFDGKRGDEGRKRKSQDIEAASLVLLLLSMIWMGLDVVEFPGRDSFSQKERKKEEDNLFLHQCEGRRSLILSPSLQSIGDTQSFLPTILECSFP